MPSGLKKLEGLAVVAGLHDQLRRAQKRIAELEAKSSV